MNKTIFVLLLLGYAALQSISLHDLTPDQLVVKYTHSGNMLNISNKNLDTLEGIAHLQVTLETHPDIFISLSDVSHLCIDAHHNNIKQLPKEIGNLPNLINLNISCNKINELPITISELKKLKILNIASNQFKTLPDAIYDLEELECLYLQKNQFSHIELHISHTLPCLKSLFVFENPLSSSELQKLEQSVFPRLKPYIQQGEIIGFNTLNTRLWFPLVRVPLSR